MMQDRKELFDESLLVSIFEEVIQVYTRIKQEKSTIAQNSLQKSSTLLHQLQQQEAQMHEQELSDIEKLLDF
jgi:ATP-dependent Lon protease